MDVERQSCRVNGEAITLPLKEFDLLEYLMRNSGRVLTRGQLIDRVWGADYVGDTKTLDVHVKRLRAKIEADPANPVHLVTVRGLGYKLEDAPSGRVRRLQTSGGLDAERRFGRRGWRGGRRSALNRCAAYTSPPIRRRLSRRAVR